MRNIQQGPESYLDLGAFMDDFLVVIPARFRSVRLPGKPLISIKGIPMIVRTWMQCSKVVPKKAIYVATDDFRIFQVCRENGIQVVMTSENCMTGTDRVAQFAEMMPARSYINVQGDEPAFNPDDIVALIAAAADFPDDIINGYCPIVDETQYFSTSIPKVVFRADGKLLYMSRSPIPGNKQSIFETAYRQVCAYAYPSEALRVFHSEPMKTPMEKIEDIELLRFLELGFDIRMIPMSSMSVSVDHPQDIELAEKKIDEMGWTQ